MVKIKNIFVDGNTISMDCYKEGDMNKHFHLVIDAITFDVISTTLSHPSIYLRQAVKKIVALSQSGPLPEEAISVWC